MAEVIGCTLDVASPKRSWKEKYWIGAADVTAAKPLAKKWAQLRAYLLASDCYVRRVIVFDPNHERDSKVASSDRISQTAWLHSFAARDSGLQGLNGAATNGFIPPDELVVNSAPVAIGFRFDAADNKWHTRLFRGVPDCLIRAETWYGPSFTGYNPADADTEINGNSNIVTAYRRVLNWYCKYLRHVVTTKVDGAFVYTPKAIEEYSFNGVTERKTSKKATL